MNEINIYCDESSHLSYDNKNYMILGAVYCKKEVRKRICNDIKRIKQKYNLDVNSEMKWTKICNSKLLPAYMNLIEYFFSEPNLKFRGLIAQKNNLDNDKYNCTDLYEYNPLFNDETEARMICQKRLDCIDYLKDFNIEKYKSYEKYVSTSKGRKHRIILIDEEHKYIYVLEHHKTHILLWTGYDIPNWKLKKELKNYEQYVKTNTILE